MADSFFRFRLDPDIRRLLDRLRDEKDISVSRWVRRQVRNALRREFPDDVTAESAKEPSIATTVTPEREPAQTPTIGTSESAKEPSVATTVTPEREPAQTPTIGTSEVPDPDLTTNKTDKRPQKPLIVGWKPDRFDGGEWGAVLEGERVAELPASHELPGTPIEVTDSKGDAWITTILAVVSRSAAKIVVTNTGRPRD